MASESIDFGPTIRAYAQKHGLDLDAEKVARTSAIMQTAAVIEGVKLTGFDMGPGGIINLDDMIASEVVSAPRRSISAVKLKTPANRTELAIATNLAKRESAKSSAASDGNPWLAATYSRTNQALITNRNPELAAALRVAPGAIS